jgi:hypothetical protein
MEDGRALRDRLIALASIGILFVNYPLLSVFSKAEPVLGIPFTYLYLFVGWALFILSAWVVMGREGLRDQDGGDRQDRDDGE